MNKRNLLIATATMLSAVAALAGSAAAATVTVDATSGAGSNLNLGAGTYTVTELAGASATASDLWTTGGANPQPSVTCGATAGGCRYGWVSSVDVTANGVSTSYFQTAPSGSTRTYAVYDTPDDALAGFQAAEANDGLYSVTNNVTTSNVGTISFTLPTSGTVNFAVPDNLYSDNTGGLTLSVASVSAAPEPSTWLLLIAGVGVTGFALRRKPQLATAA